MLKIELPALELRINCETSAVSSLMTRDPVIPAAPDTCNAPLTIEEPVRVRVFDDVRNVRLEAAPNAPSALNWMLELDPAGDPLPPVDAIVTDPSDPVVRVTFDPARR
jgi:hypothetical protein